MRIIVLLITFSLNAFAINIVTTLPEFAWMAKQMYPRAQVKSLLAGSEDPHFIDATPSFVFKVAKADMVIINGMDLEVGWIGKVLELSGNRKVQLMAKGFCNASSEVSKIEILNKFDRSMGDVHPVGNPHYTLSPKRMIEVTESLKKCFERIGIKDVQTKPMIQTFNELDQKMKKLKGTKILVFHREFNYLKEDYGLKILGSIEKVPGVLPSATHLAKISKEAKKSKPKVTLAAYTNSKNILEKFKELSGVPYTQLNLHPVNEQGYPKFIESFLKRLGF